MKIFYVAVWKEQCIAGIAEYRKTYSHYSSFYKCVNTQWDFKMPGGVNRVKYVLKLIIHKLFPGKWMIFSRLPG